MTVSASNHADVYTDFQGLARLRAQARQESPQALREAAQQVEALFLQMMLKSMREASTGEGIMDNEQTKMFQGMYDQQLGIELSKGKGLGLADSLVRQLGRAEPLPQDGPRQLTLDRTRLQLSTPAIQSGGQLPELRTGQAKSDAWRPQSPQEFVQDLWPHAQRAAQQLGTRPEVLIAQSALETGWGRSVMRHPDGESSHNLFGIKADKHWDGERVYSRTMEFRDGHMQRERAAFRSYDSLEQSFNDYVNFIQQNPRYGRALEQAADGARYVRELQEAGYATDPEYADKINAIMRGDILSQARSMTHV